MTDDTMRLFDLDGMDWSDCIIFRRSSVGSLEAAIDDVMCVED